MPEITTIQVDISIVNALKDIRDYPGQTYGELIEKMIHTYHNVKSKNQYDEFLYKIQQVKMKELWDNKDDETWENAQSS